MWWLFIISLTIPLSSLEKKDAIIPYDPIVEFESLAYDFKEGDIKDDILTIGIENSFYIFNRSHN